MGDEELMEILLYSDNNDVEGMVWYGNKGSEWNTRANGENFSPLFRMSGRPIGFRVHIGDHFDTELVPQTQPLIMSIIYNGCNCPASTFIGDNPI